MRDMYFLRNVVAHSAGFLCGDQLSMVPKGVAVEKGELRISEDYLQNAISCLEKAVRLFDHKLHAQHISRSGETLATDPTSRPPNLLGSQLEE